MMSTVAKTNIVNVRVRPDEREALGAIMGLEGISRSEAVRRAIALYADMHHARTPSERIAGEMRRQVQVESNGHVRNR